MRVLALLCALLLGVGAALLTGCGDRSKLLPQQDAAALRTQLQAVNGAVTARDCQRTDATIAQARARVKELPASVDSRLVERLLRGLETLRERAAGECDPRQVTTTTVPTTTTPQTVPETTTDAAPPQTTDTSTQPVTPADTGTTTPTVPSPADGGTTPAPGTTTGKTPPADGGVSPGPPGTSPPLP